MVERRVILKSFLGSIKPKSKPEARENYWKLIGEKGEVIDTGENDNRLLVLFESNLDDYQLENHNPIRNTLWIKESDLQFL